MRGDQIVVAALVQTGEHPLVHDLPRHTQQGADQRWAKQLWLVLGVNQVT